jgi:hypothetical protein
MIRHSNMRILLRPDHGVSTVAVTTVTASNLYGDRS